MAPKRGRGVGSWSWSCELRAAGLLNAAASAEQRRPSIAIDGLEGYPGVSDTVMKSRYMERDSKEGAKDGGNKNEVEMAARLTAGSEGR